MNGALFSIRPQFAAEILAGTKTTEMRRRAPNVAPGDTVIVYETSPTRAIVGLARVSSIVNGPARKLWSVAKHSAGLSRREYYSYLSGCPTASAIHLRGAVRFRESIPLSEARKLAPSFTPPQSWCYLQNLPVMLTARLSAVAKANRPAPIGVGADATEILCVKRSG